MSKDFQQHNSLLEDFIDDLEHDEVVQDNVRVEDKTYAHSLTFLVSFRRRVDAESMCSHMRRMCNIIRGLIERCSAIGDYNAEIWTIDPKVEDPKTWPRDSRKPVLKRTIDSSDADEPLRELIRGMKERKLGGSIMFDINVGFDYSVPNISNRSAFDLLKLICDIREFLYKFCNSFSQQSISQETEFDKMRINPGINDVDKSGRSDALLMEKITRRADSKDYLMKMIDEMKRRKMGEFTMPDWLMKELTENVRRFKDNIDQWVRMGATVEVKEDDKEVILTARKGTVRAIDVQWVIYCLCEWLKAKELDYKIRTIVPGVMSFN